MRRRALVVLAVAALLVLAPVDAGVAVAQRGTPVDAAEARTEARRILDGARYRSERVPRPFRGVLRRIGGWLRPLGRPFAWLAERRWGLALLGLAVVLLAVVGATRLARRRVAVASTDRAHHRHDGAAANPAALEREADEAERNGDYAAACRLRFRAGLLRLGQAGVLDYRASLTAGEVRRTVGSPTLSRLASSFEEITYGGKPARREDIDEARAGWPRVLADAGARR